MSTWKKIEGSRLVRSHATSPAEIATHMASAERNLRDASVPALSDDGRFLMAYNAAFQLATIALFASGYQAHGDDHHKTTFSALPLAMGASFTLLADYLDRCRRKRNNIQYDQINVATASEADELYKRTLQFRVDLLSWLSKSHPTLATSTPAS